MRGRKGIRYRGRGILRLSVATATEALRMINNNFRELIFKN